MSTFLRIGTLLLFVALGACLAVGVARGVTLRDLIALCRGNPLTLRQAAASSEERAPRRLGTKDQATGPTTTKSNAGSPQGSAPCSDPWSVTLPSVLQSPTDLASEAAVAANPTAATTEPRRLPSPRVDVPDLPPVKPGGNMAIGRRRRLAPSALVPTARPAPRRRLRQAAGDSRSPLDLDHSGSRQGTARAAGLGASPRAGERHDQGQ